MGAKSKKELMAHEDPLVQMLAQKLGENVRALRKSQNLTQERLGYMIGTKHARISDIERGLVVARLSDIVKLADAFNVRLEDIIDLSAFDPSDCQLAGPVDHARL